jgi:threonine dehydrogenase-like Zn-dependent dehydrogenase
VGGGFRHASRAAGVAKAASLAGKRDQLLMGALSAPQAEKPGQQGLACTFAAKCAGAARISVTGIGRDAERLEVAKKFGAHRTINVEKENVLEVVREETGGEMADVVVDVSGNVQAIRTSVECVRTLGTLVVGGLTRDGIDVPLYVNLIVRRQIRFQGAFTTDNDATEIAMRAIHATGFPVQEMGHAYFLFGRNRKAHPRGGRRDPRSLSGEGVD